MKRTVGPKGEAVWRQSSGNIEIRFVGRRNDDASPPAGQTIREVESRPVPVAWCRQIHSDQVHRADSSGMLGEGDGLFTDRTELALAVVTADCVPVLLASEHQVAAVHAGWRGIAARIVPTAIDELVVHESAGSANTKPQPSAIRAWIGPAIGPCCYEVSEEVAEAVAKVSDSRVIRSGSGPRPHLDLVAAVIEQLKASGVEAISTAEACTRCSEDDLWSYRRDGPGRGRNLAWIFRAGYSAAR